MRLSKKIMKGREEYLIRMLSEKENCLKKAPDGSLRITSCKGTPQFRHAETGEETYLSKTEMPLIRAIAQKEYDQKVVEVGRSELTTLTALINKYDKGTVEDIYDKLVPARRELAEPIELPDDEFIKRWLEEPYRKARFADGEPEFYTSNGLRVRSKSEIIFAEKYDEHGIPFRYEPPIYLEGFGWARPDFELLIVESRQTIYHEHLGMMDDPEYAERNIKKVRAYERNGYVIGRNLILTFETKSSPIGPADAERLISNFLL